MSDFLHILPAFWIAAILPAVLGAMAAGEELERRHQPQVGAVAIGITLLVLGPATIVGGLVWGLWCGAKTARLLLAKPPTETAPKTEEGTYR